MISLDNEEERIEKINDSYFAHHCKARVIDGDEGLVAIGDIKIELHDKIPGWAKEGDLIEFDCSRLDVW